MANPEHLAKLQEGIEEWNQWRRANPEVKPDLSNANLTYPVLSGTNLTYANLSEATTSPELTLPMPSSKTH